MGFSYWIVTEHAALFAAQYNRLVADAVQENPLATIMDILRIK